jgi:hypothetical protein
MKLAIDALAYLRATLFLSLLLSLCGAQPPPPPNDSCSGATPVALGSSLTVSLRDATFDPTLENLCNYGGSSPGLWYTFQGTGGRVAIILKDNPVAEVSVAAFTGTCGASTLQCTSPAQRFLYSYAPTYTLQTIASTTYYLLMQRGFFVDNVNVYRILIGESLRRTLILLRTSCNHVQIVPEQSVRPSVGAAKTTNHHGGPPRTPPTLQHVYDTT